MTVGDIDSYQPRFRAWLRFLGAQTGDAVVTVEYMIWNSAEANEFERVRGRRPSTSEAMSNDFTDWLDAKAAEAEEMRQMCEEAIGSV